MKKLVFVGVLISFLYSCNSTNKVEEKNKLLVKIQQNEKKLYNDSLMELDVTIADSTVNLYTKFANEYPDDTSSAEYLFRAAEICKSLNKGKLSLSYYERLEKNYPKFPKMPVCIFMQGFVCENHLKDFENAKYNYQRFIDNYPKHPLVHDTKILIENLGKSPEELIKSFQEKENINKSQNN
ncbi:MAG: hypothetical protein A2X08_08400 [Bacteroidetes bacterium GWA2_32_17]|nr:MAG: hypothetical protein A2X08_08400 [Bacteroidetes bacterium GWA2_32_17]